MNTRLQRSDLPKLRDFLDDLPKKPCPSKLPEDYCKLCRRLNGEVAHYCETHELPPSPEKEALVERKEPEIEEVEGPRIAHTKVPILERPTYKEGETSLEFVPSEKSIEEARKSLPRFIPVHQGPRAFRPILEPSPEEFETFALERPSIFRSPSSIAEGEDDMMFTLVADEEATEVIPLEIEGEGSIPSETIFESTDGVVEVVEIPEGVGSMEREEDLPVFQFIEEDEAEIVEAEIVEAEIVEEGAIREELPKSELAPKIRKKRRIKRRRIKRKLRLKKIKEKKPEEAAEVRPEPVPKEPKEESLEGMIGPTEEITTSEDIPKEEGLGIKFEPGPSEEMRPSEEITTEGEVEEILVEPKAEAVVETVEGSTKETEEHVEEVTKTEKEETDLYMCPSCGSFISSSATICMKCGFDFEAEEGKQAVEELSQEKLEPKPGEEIVPSAQIIPEAGILDEKPEDVPKVERQEPEPSPEMIPSEEVPKEERLE
ncbi:MAG: zinc ribbon domain-containing protein, partial [Thermoplasmata archaeon]